MLHEKKNIKGKQKRVMGMPEPNDTFDQRSIVFAHARADRKGNINANMPRHHPPPFCPFSMCPVYREKLNVFFFF